MIHLILGKPGAGKSHEAVQTYVIPNLEKGRKIITNLPLNLEYLYSIYPEAEKNNLIVIKMGANGSPYDAFSSISDFDDDWRDPKTGQGAFFIIDEAHFCLDSALGQKKLKPIEDWFSTHRQTGSDVLLITQTAKKISKRVLDMVELYIKLRKAGLFGGFTSVFTKGGSENMYFKHSFSSLERNEKPIRSERKTYQKSIHNCYKSHLLSNAPVQENNDFRVGKIALVKNTWYIWLILILLCFVLYRVFFGDSVNPMEQKKVDKKNIPQNVVSPKSPKSVDLKNNNKNKVIEKKKEKKTIKGVSPFDEFDIFIKSSYYNTARIIYTFSFEKDGEELFFLTSEELKDVQYSVFKFGKFPEHNPCVVILKYKEETEYIYCKKEEDEEMQEMQENRQMESISDIEL